MRVPDSIRWSVTARDETRQSTKDLDTIYAAIRNALNGGIQPDENAGVVISGTYTVAAGNAETFNHGLGWTPKFAVFVPAENIGATATTFYFIPADKLLWNSDDVVIRCTRTSTDFEAWII